MKARQAKKILRNLSVMCLSPGDVLVLRSPLSLSPQTREAIGSQLGRFFPAHKVVVLDRGMELSAVRGAAGG